MNASTQTEHHELADELLNFVDRGMVAQLMELVHSERVFTDLLIEEGERVMAKGPLGWEPVDSVKPTGREAMADILAKLDPDWENTIQNRAINRPVDLEEWRLRVNAYLAHGGKKLMMAIRKIPVRPIALKDTGLPASSRLMLESPRGLILISGATGSGKSTTLAALLDAINEARSAHIVTIEDPIEYRFERKKAIFSQREVGVDVANFFEGVRDAMRQSPNVIAIGEIRDRDTADTALLAAESGHLVLGTLHANSAGGAVQKLLGYFGSGEREARLASLAATLVGVVSQVLLPAADAKGYALAAELLFNHKRQFARVLDDPEKIATLLDRKEDGVSRSMADAMVELVGAKRVTKIEALRATAAGQGALYERLKSAA